MKTKKRSSDGLNPTKPMTQKQAEVAAAVVLTDTTNKTPLLNPEVQAARERMRKEAQSRLKVTKDHFTQGMLNAIDTASILGDPMAQIAGWRELGKAHGHYEPQRVIVQHEGPVTELRLQLSAMSDEELSKMTGETLEGEFYEIRN